MTTALKPLHSTCLRQLTVCLKVYVDLAEKCSSDESVAVAALAIVLVSSKHAQSHSAFNCVYSGTCHLPEHMLGPGHLPGQDTRSGCSSNCWGLTTTPQIWEAGRPRPQEKGVTGTFAGTFTGTNTGTKAGNFDSNTLPYKLCM